MREAQITNAFISQSPRFMMEAIGAILIVLFAYHLSMKGVELAGSMPMLGVLALGAQRLLPVLQQAFQGWASIRANQSSLSDSLDLLDQPIPVSANGSNKEEKLAFNRDISIRIFASDTMQIVN